MTKEEQIRQECWEKSHNAIGTSYVFTQKAKKYKTIIRVITILGLVVPLLIGATVIAYGKNSNALNIALFITTPIACIQIVLSGISLGLKWDDLLAYSLESQTDNRIIFDDYQKLAKYSAINIYELEKEFEVIKAKDNARTTQDEKVTFTAKDNRKGMRYGLYILKKECATCKNIPQSMTPTKCDTCGNF
jgi:mobilome CxxCx(11)CxxC protein